MPNEVLLVEVAQQIRLGEGNRVLRFLGRILYLSSHIVTPKVILSFTVVVSQRSPLYP